MASYSFWQAKTVAQLSAITDGVTDADKAYMEAYAYDQMAAVFAELGSGPSGSLVDLTVRLAVSLQADGDLVPASVTASLVSETLTVANLIVPGATTFNTVAYTWTGSDGGAGDVLTTDGAGNLTWTTPSVSSPLWTQSGSNIYYPSGGIGVAGNVAIGMTAPTFRLSVRNATAQFIVLDDPGNVLLYIDSGTNTLSGPSTTMGYYFYHLYATADLDVGSGDFTVSSVGNVAAAGNLDVEGLVALGSGATPTAGISVWVNAAVGAGGTVYGALSQYHIAGAITDFNATWVTVSTDAPSAITNLYNFRISEGSKTGGTTITNQYGLKIEDLNDATNNWSIFTGLGSVYLGGNTTISGSLSASSLGISTSGTFGTSLTSSTLIVSTTAVVGTTLIVGSTLTVGGVTTINAAAQVKTTAAVAFQVTNAGGSTVFAVNTAGGTEEVSIPLGNLLYAYGNFACDGLVYAFGGIRTCPSIGLGGVTEFYRLDLQDASSNDAYRIKSTVVNSAVWFIWENDARKWWGGVRTDDIWALYDGTGANYRFMVATNGDISGTHGTYHISSDERLKTNVVDITDALETVCNLRGVHYNWIKPPYMRDGKQTGMIAQEVDAVAPELTQVAEDEMGTMSIKDDISIDAYLVEAIKELKRRHDQEIDVLKVEIDKLKVA
jgi:hypothetical protein